MKTIEQIALEVANTIPSTGFISDESLTRFAEKFLTAWLEQQSQEPVAYMAPSGTCVTAEDVSYTPNWTDYYTTPLVRQSDAAAVIAAKDAEIERQTQSKARWKKVADENLKGMLMCREQLAAVEKQRDDLLAAAENVLRDKRGEDQWLILSVHCRQLEEVIAKVKGAA